MIKTRMDKPPNLSGNRKVESTNVNREIYLELTRLINDKKVLNNLKQRIHIKSKGLQGESPFEASDIIQNTVLYILSSNVQWDKSKHNSFKKFFLSYLDNEINKFKNKILTTNKYKKENDGKRLIRNAGINVNAEEDDTYDEQFTLMKNKGKFYQIKNHEENKILENIDLEKKEKKIYENMDECERKIYELRKEGYKNHEIVKKLNLCDKSKLENSMKKIKRKIKNYF